MNILDFLAIGLSAHRLTSLLVDESGPFNIFLKIRELTGIRHEEQGNIISIPDNFFANLISCFLCVSLWMALFSYIIWWLWDIPIYILGASSLAILIDKVIRSK